ncbi:MAG TPA: immunoglobulin domain-containing protein [Verrucomicrobiae bacterium]
MDMSGGYYDTGPAQWSGVTFSSHQANEPVPGLAAGAPYTVPLFDRYAPTFVDRSHRYSEVSATSPVLPVPSYLVGGEYIMTGNDNRDNASYQLDVYVSEPVVVFMLVDNRLNDGANGDPPNYTQGVDPAAWTTMTWLGTEGYQPLITGWNRANNPAWPDEVGVDEGSDGSVNNWYSVYWKQVPAGMFSLYQADNSGRNMYGAVVTPVAPRAPTGLSAISLNARVTLFWSASAGATNYIVKRSTVSGGPYVEIGQTSGLTYTDTSVVNFQTYYYVVSAVGLFGEGAYSAQVVGTPKLAPENFTANGGTNQVTLSWSPLTGADSYMIKRSDASGGPYITIASNLTATSYVDAGLAAGRRYFYTASAALTGGGESANADEAVGITAPNNLTNVLAQSFAASVIQLKWRVLDAFNPTVLIERSADGVSFANLAVVTSTAREFYHTNLPALSTNYYRLVATNAGGSSVYSAVVSASTPAWALNVNFANNTNGNVSTMAPTPPGYYQDIGLPYAARGNGQSYGWDIDNTANSRYRQAANSPDLRYDTFNHLQKQSPSAVWEMAIPNGLYLAHIVCGDATATDSTFQWDIEGWISGTKVPNNPNYWQEFYLTTKVEDGKLTLTSGPSAGNNKIAFLDLYQAVPTPNTISVQPTNQTVVQNRPVTFAVGISGGPEPYRCQWYGPAGLIYGEESPVLTIPLPQPSDAGVYYCIVTNAGAGVTSSNAILTVTPDTVPPTVVSVGSLDGNSVGVVFDEVVDESIAMDPNRYVFTAGGGSVIGATRRADGKTVHLDLAAPITGAFTIRVDTMKDLAGNERASSSASGTVLGFTKQDLSFLGSAFTGDGNVIEVVGSGADIWGTADAFMYVYKVVSGDFDAKVRVESLTQANVWSKAGIMARENDLPGSRNVMILTTPLPLNNLQQTQWRDIADSDSAAKGEPGPVTYPDAWVRLVREGNRFISLFKTNNTDWVLAHTYTPSAAYPSAILLGLAVTAHDAALTATGIFSGYSVTLGQPAADIKLTKAANPGSVSQGGTVTYTITAVNQGAGTANSVVVTDPLPAGLTYSGNTATLGSAVYSAGTVTWTIGTLTNGQSTVLTLTATAEATGSIVNTATAASAGTDENPANNSASAAITVIGKPTLTVPTYANGKFSMSLATAPGVTYKIIHSADIAAPLSTWATLTTILGDGTTKVIEDSAPALQQYYAVVITSP